MRTRSLLVALATVLTFDAVVTALFWEMEQNPILLDMGLVPATVFKLAFVPVTCGVYLRYRQYRITRLWAGFLTLMYALIAVGNVLGIVSWL